MTVVIVLVLVVCAGIFSWVFTAIGRCGEDAEELLLRLRKEKQIDISPLLRRDGDDVLEQDGNTDYMRKVASMGRRSSLLVTLSLIIQRGNPERSEHLEMCAAAILLRLAFWGCVAEFGIRSARKFLSRNPVSLPLFFPRIAAEIYDHMERTVGIMVESHQT